MNELFQKNTTASAHLFLLIILSLILMTADRHERYVPTIRSYLAIAVTPFYYIVHFPMDVFNEMSDSMVSHNALLIENKALKKERLELKVQLQSFHALEEENKHLLRLLGAGPKLERHFEIVKVMLPDLDPFQQQFMIDKGSNHGVKTGFSLFDERGVIGQVVEVGGNTSRVMMITDPEHTLPVEVERSHFRTVAKGSSNGKLSLLYLHSNSTNLVKEGDTIITSGQGGVFPAGYPVGKVILIRPEVGLPYAHAQVEVSSNLNTNRIALVVWSNDDDKVDATSSEQQVRPRNVGADIQADDIVDPEQLAQ